MVMNRNVHKSRDLRHLLSYIAYSNSFFVFAVQALEIQKVAKILKNIFQDFDNFLNSSACTAETKKFRI